MNMGFDDGEVDTLTSASTVLVHLVLSLSDLIIYRRVRHFWITCQRAKWKHHSVWSE